MTLEKIIGILALIYLGIQFLKYAAFGLAKTFNREKSVETIDYWIRKAKGNYDSFGDWLFSNMHCMREIFVIVIGVYIVVKFLSFV